MDATTTPDPALAGNDATTERMSDREIVVSRTVNGPARLVFEAWTKAELLERWWSPKSFPITLLSCETDARVGGRYRLVFGYEGSTFEFFGRYLEVTPPSRLVWTNEEAGDGEQITTVTFEETGGRTRVVVHDLYASKEALDGESASHGGMAESLGQLDELLVELRASARE
jgi:uncharacterized protein YndB with AHSA1/START domain